MFEMPNVTEHCSIALMSIASDDAEAQDALLGLRWDELGLERSGNHFSEALGGEERGPHRRLHVEVGGGELLGLAVDIGNAAVLALDTPQLRIVHRP